MTEKDAARFWSKVEKGGNCWRWTGALSSHGYSRFWLASRGNNAPAHRIAFELINGPIPSGLHLDHLCRNRACINPAHMEPVTIKQNMMRGHTYAAHNAQKTHCKRGHPFDEKNTHITARGNRECRACNVLKTLRYQARQREKLSP